jgi:hypothetical protein
MGFRGKRREETENGVKLILIAAARCTTDVGPLGSKPEACQLQSRWSSDARRDTTGTEVK